MMHERCQLPKILNACFESLIYIHILIGTPKQIDNTMLLAKTRRTKYLPLSQDIGRPEEALTLPKAPA